MVAAEVIYEVGGAQQKTIPMFVHANPYRSRVSSHGAVRFSCSRVCDGLGQQCEVRRTRANRQSIANCSKSLQGCCLQYGLNISFGVRDLAGCRMESGIGTVVRPGSRRKRTYRFSI